MSIETECSFAVPKDTWTNDIRNKTPPTIGSATLINYEPSNSVHLPSASFDWRTPVNYLTSDRGDNTPSLCSSSWAFAVTTVMSDKIKIKTKGKSNIQISPQVLLNCGVGTCSKGHPEDAIVFARKFGLPEESCQNYLGTTPSKSTCTDVQNCATCTGTLFNFNCTASKGAKRWIVPDSGKVSGVAAMKA
jgi:cathepsin X